MDEKCLVCFHADGVAALTVARVLVQCGILDFARFATARQGLTMQVARLRSIGPVWFCLHMTSEQRILTFQASLQRPPQSTCDWARGCSL